MFKIVLLSFLASLVSGEKNCDELGTLLYDDLGCKPIFKNGKCPVKYECDFTQKENTCLIHGVYYNASQEIEQKDISNPCQLGCFCNPGGFGPITCAVLDCFGPAEKDCFKTYELNKCCSTGKICPPFPEETCVVDGKTYYPGQNFETKGQCLTCNCQKGFKGELKEPFCRRLGCAAQIRSSKDIESFCAAAYIFSRDNTLCCPDAWLCPEPSDVFINFKPSIKENSEFTCKYGDKKVQLGHGFLRKINEYGTERIMKCECILPPFLTCTESKN